LLISQPDGAYYRPVCARQPESTLNGLDSMQHPEKAKPRPPLLHRSDDGTPLSRELTTLRLLQLVDFINRSASREFPRVSGLSDFEWRAVAQVCESPRLSINDLSGVLHRGVAQVSRTVKKLVAAGLLERAKRPSGPGVLISSTTLGRTLYNPIERLVRQRNAAFVAGLSAAQLKILDHCIEIMTPNAQALLDHELQLQAAKQSGPKQLGARGNTSLPLQMKD
jgi:DNA-binding MarR family transcriptional regulator